MLKRMLTLLSLSIAFLVAVQPLRSVHGNLMTDTEVSMLNAGDTAATENSFKQEGSGNAFVAALKAPFRALGRLFGRGKKDDNKLHRLSEKDVKKFESAQVTRVNDASSVSPPAPSEADMSSAGHLERGRALLNASHLNEAIAELSLAASMDPKLSESHNLLGVAYQLKGLPEMARKSFEMALKIEKNNAQILNNFGYLLYCNGDYRGALKRLKEAARLAPDDARILNNLALAQSQLGKFDEAEKNFVRAGGEIDGRLNIANRLELAGRSQEASKHYEAARAVAEGGQKANSNSLMITVAMEIKNGRVTYAAVENRRPGMEAYEASALRVARQRRYPSDKNGQESIVVRVSSLPAS